MSGWPFGSKLLMTVLATLTLTASMHASHAAIIDLDPGTTSYYTGNGAARGIHFTADMTFTISSIGIYADLAAKTFDALIYSGDTGGSANLAASAFDQTPVELETGEAWHDIALNYTFQSDNDYIILWRPNDQEANTWVIGGDLLAYDLIGNWPDDDVDVGEVTLRGGKSNFNAEDDNGSIPRMRFNGVPEPAALPVMLMLGSAALMRRRRTGPARPARLPNEMPTDL